MTRNEELKLAVLTSLNDESPHKVTDEILAIPGMSGAKYKRFSNRLLSNSIVRNYLEIGVWKGSTAIAALHGNHDRLKYTVIDNFSEFGGPKHDFMNNWEKYIGGKPNLIDEDCFSIFPKSRGISDIDVYFYDGEHEAINHYRGLQYYYHTMADSFIFMVDDWSWEKVQRGTYMAFDELGVKVLFKVEHFGSNDAAGWWNGCGIFVLQK